MNEDSNPKLKVTLDWKIREKTLPFTKNRKTSLSHLYPVHELCPAPAPKEKQIRQRTIETNQLGEQPLWSGYNQLNATRQPSKVLTERGPARFYAAMVRKLQPNVILEFGSAFGVSGMYWVAALEANSKGHLYTYEVNEAWAKIAEANISAISDRFTLTRGLFEEHVDATLKDEQIDIAFIDGVHTAEWVVPQYEIVVKHLAPNGIIILDDITFGPDMEQCWEKLSSEGRVRNAFRLNHRVGVIQLKNQ